MQWRSSICCPAKLGECIRLSLLLQFHFCLPWTLMAVWRKGGGGGGAKDLCEQESIKFFICIMAGILFFYYISHPFLWASEKFAIPRDSLLIGVLLSRISRPLITFSVDDVLIKIAREREREGDVQGLQWSCYICIFILKRRLCLVSLTCIDLLLFNLAFMAWFNLDQRDWWNSSLIAPALFSIHATFGGSMSSIRSFVARYTKNLNELISGGIRNTAGCKICLFSSASFISLPLNQLMDSFFFWTMKTWFSTLVRMLTAPQQLMSRWRRNCVTHPVRQKRIRGSKYRLLLGIVATLLTGYLDW